MNAYKVRIKITSEVEFVECGTDKTDVINTLQKEFMPRFNRGYLNSQFINNAEMSNVQITSKL